MEENNNGRLARIADVFLSLSRKQLTSTVMRLIIKLCSTNRALLRTPLTIHSRSSRLLLSYLSLFLSPPRCFTFIVPQRETRKYRGNSEESGRNKELGLSLSLLLSLYPSLSFRNLPRAPDNPGGSVRHDGRQPLLCPGECRPGAPRRRKSEGPAVRGESVQRRRRNCVTWWLRRTKQ